MELALAKCGKSIKTHKTIREKKMKPQYAIRSLIINNVYVISMHMYIVFISYHMRSQLMEKLKQN